MNKISSILEQEICFKVYICVFFSFDNLKSAFEQKKNLLGYEDQKKLDSESTNTESLGEGGFQVIEPCSLKKLVYKSLNSCMSVSVKSSEQICYTLFIWSWGGIQGPTLAGLVLQYQITPPAITGFVSWFRPRASHRLGILALSSLPAPNPILVNVSSKFGRVVMA